MNSNDTIRTLVAGNRTPSMELDIDLGAADWEPGEPCPACGNQTVHAIVRAGMRFHADGSWNVDEMLAIYEAYCPDCDWLPPVSSGER